MTQFLVLFPDSKSKENKPSKRPRPRPPVVGDLFVFLIGLKLCNKLDDTVNLLYCIVFFSFCNKIFLNNKWGVRCFTDSALHRFVEVSGTWVRADVEGRE